MRRACTLIVLVTILTLCGCGTKKVDQEQTTVPEVSYLHEPIQSYTWNGYTFDNIFPASSFSETSDGLDIFPCYDSDAHISVGKIIISGNGFWDSVITQYSNTNNIVERDNYSYVTAESGETIGYIENDNNSAYVVRSSTLPSGYVDYVLSILSRT